MPPKSDCPFCRTHIRTQQSRELGGTSPPVEIPIRYCTHDQSPCTRGQARGYPPQPLRCQGLVRLCTIPGGPWGTP